MEDQIKSCQLCPYETKFGFALEHHKKNHSEPHLFNCSSDLAYYSCKECDTELLLKLNHSRHVCSMQDELVCEVEDEPEEYPCEKCDFVTSSQLVWYGHDLHHFNLSEAIVPVNAVATRLSRELSRLSHSLYTCEECTYESHKKSQLHEHELIRHDIKPPPNVNYFVCEHCGFKSTFAYRIKSHNCININIKIEFVTSNYYDEEDYSCDLCSYKSCDKFDYYEHLCRKHNEDPPDGVPVYTCEKCSYKTIDDSKLMQHKCIFNCQFCEFKSTQADKLKSHKCQMSNNNEGFCCDVCSYMSYHSRSLYEHLLKRHDRNPPSHIEIYKCGKCDYQTTINSSFVRHECKFHCKFCEFKTSQFDLLESHECQRSLRPKPRGSNDVTEYKCTLCSYKSYQRKQYLAHCSRQHYNKATDGTYRCTKCRYITKNRLDFADHVYINHNLILDFVKEFFNCKSCEFKSTREHFMKQHQMRTNHEANKSLTSEFSARKRKRDDSFTQADENQKKRARNDFPTHSKVFQNRCSECDYSSSRRQVLGLHMFKHHNIKVDFIKQFFECKPCQYRTTRLDLLNSHQLSGNHKLLGKIKTEETTQNLFSCNKCEYTSKYKRDFGEHMFKKHNLKPSFVTECFKCNICQFKTTRRLLFNKHQFLTRHKANAKKSAKVNPRRNKQPEKPTFRKFKTNKYPRAKKPSNQQTVDDTLSEDAFKFGDDLYHCNECDYISQFRRGFAEHMLSIHSIKVGFIKSIYKCVLCEFKTTRADYFRKHQLTSGHEIKAEKSGKVDQSEDSNHEDSTTEILKSPQNVFNCSKCQYTSKWKQDFGDHVFKQHNLRPSFVKQFFNCDDCPFKTTRRSKLYKHQCNNQHKSRSTDKVSSGKRECRGSPPSKLKTPIEAKTFTDEPSSSQQSPETTVIEETLKSSQNVFSCPKCQYTSKWKQDFGDHVFKQHNLRPSFVKQFFNCDDCPFKTTRRSELYKHQRKTQHKSRSTDKVSSGNRERRESPPSKLKTPIEAKTFTDEPSNSQQSPETTVIEETLKSSKNVFSCPKCQYSTKWILDFSDHLFRQHNLRPSYAKEFFRCDDCPFKTVKRSQVSWHQFKTQHKSYSSDKVRSGNGDSKESAPSKFKRKRTKSTPRQSKSPIEASTFKPEPSETAAIEEMLKSHQKVLTCPRCEHTSNWKEDFIEHLFKEHNLKVNSVEDIFGCGDCQFRTTKRSLLWRHQIQTLHKSPTTETKPAENKSPIETKPFTAEPSSSLTYTTLDEKLFKSGHDRYKCNKCDFTSKFRRGFAEHMMNRHHTKLDFIKKVFACDLCEFKSTRTDYFSKHEEIEHGDKTEESEAKKDHKDSPTEVLKSVQNPFHCPKCEYSTKWKRDLGEHLFRKHNVKPSFMRECFKCDVCQFKTVKPSVFKRHEFVTQHKATAVKTKGTKVNHKENKKPTKASSPKLKTCVASPEKSFESKPSVDLQVCKLCNFKTTNSAYFKLHMCSLEFTEPFTCVDCDYVGEDNAQLQSHLPIHGYMLADVTASRCKLCNFVTTGSDTFASHKCYLEFQKPFICVECVPEKEYINKSDLQNHLIGHGYKLDIPNFYECKECSFSTSKLSVLASHEPKHKR